MGRVTDILSRIFQSIRQCVIFDKKTFPIFSVIILLSMLGFMVVRYNYNRPYRLALFVQQDVARLADILHTIDAECSILQIKYDKVPIDFLTVKSFIGSEIGGLNVAYPEKWNGPYVHDNPDITGQIYQIVKAKDGYFIVPSDGFELPSGWVLGYDVVISPRIALGPMLKPGGALTFKDIAFGVKLPFIIGDFPSESKPQRLKDPILYDLTLWYDDIVTQDPQMLDQLKDRFDVASHMQKIHAQILSDFLL
jgi:hypothetical protein